jgi:hypothetical protein
MVRIKTCRLTRNPQLGDPGAWRTLLSTGRPSPRWRPSLLGWRAVVRIPLLVARGVPGAELRALSASVTVELPLTVRLCRN